MRHLVRGVLVGIACGAVLITAARASEQAEGIANIGSRLELFVDRHLIENMDGCSLELHEPTPAGVAIRFDEPWEGRYVGYVTVIKDGDTYRMYYRGLPVAKHAEDTETTCYAESRDGIHWTKPPLGIHEIDGSRDNNVIISGVYPASHNFSPFVDTRPGVPAEERYKAAGGNHNVGLLPFVSADGIHWNRLQEEAIFKQGALDSQNVIFWSEHERKYLCYYRTWTTGAFKGIRTVSRSESDDFLHWSEGVQMDFGDRPYEHLYTSQTHPYFRAPHIYVALAARFMPGRRVLTPEQFEAIGGEASYSGDCSDTVLLTSRGGNLYTRTFMEGFIRPGIGLSNWSSRTNYPTLGVVPTGPGEMSMYVQRGYGQTSHHLERLSLRTDGFISVHTGYAGGEVLTKPFRFDGGELAINYSTSAAGSVRVEIQDENGKPIAGYALDESDEIIGDEIERTVSWKGKTDVSTLAKRPVRLRFVMKDCDLYSFAFPER